MVASYSGNNRFTKQGDNDNPNTWGDILNSQVIELIDEAFSGVLEVDITGSSNVTLTSNNGSSDQSRRAVLELTGAVGADIDVICPSNDKLYVIRTNFTGGNTITFKPSGASSGIDLVTGETVFVYVSGTNIHQITAPLGLLPSNNLSDVNDADTSRSNLGIIDESVETKTSTFSVTASDRNKLFLVDASGGAVTVNLLPAATAANGFSFWVKKIDSSSNAVTIDGDSAELVEGAATQTIDTQNDMYRITSNGTAFYFTAEIKVVNTETTGQIAAFPAGAPSGWLECDGSAVSRTTYADLFAYLGTTYGAGDGSSTFNLPDYRGEFLRGFDNGAGNDPNAASRTDRGDGTTGDNVGTKQTDALQNIVGEVVIRNAGGGAAFVDQNSWTGPFGESPNTVYRARNNLASVSGTYADRIHFDASLTVRTSTETRPKNVAVRWCIRT